MLKIVILMFAGNVMTTGMDRLFARLAKYQEPVEQKEPLVHQAKEKST